MPVIDYRCPLEHIHSRYIPASKCGARYPKSEVSRCPKCRRKADRVYDSTPPSIGFTDKSQTSMVVHLNTATGEYSIPPDRDDPLPGPGYKRVAITSMRQYEKFRRQVESTLKEEAQFKQSIENEYFDQTARRHREETRQKVEQAIERGGHWVQETDHKGVTRTRWAPITPRARLLFDMACRQADKRREEIRRQKQSGSPNFHSRLLEHRASERSIVTGTAKRPVLPDLKELAERIRRSR